MMDDLGFLDKFLEDAKLCQPRITIKMKAADYEKMTKIHKRRKKEAKAESSASSAGPQEKIDTAQNETAVICEVCKSKIDGSNPGRFVATETSCKICLSCHAKAWTKTYTGCFIPACTSASWDAESDEAKLIYLLPQKWATLTEAQKFTLTNEYGISEMGTKCCDACYAKMVPKIESLIGGDVNENILPRNDNQSQSDDDKSVVDFSRQLSELTVDLAVSTVREELASPAFTHAIDTDCIERATVCSQPPHKVFCLRGHSSNVDRSEAKDVCRGDSTYSTVALSPGSSFTSGSVDSKISTKSSLLMDVNLELEELEDNEDTDSKADVFKKVKAVQKRVSVTPKASSSPSTAEKKYRLRKNPERERLDAEKKNKGTLANGMMEEWYDLNLGAYVSALIEQTMSRARHANPDFIEIQCKQCKYMVPVSDIQKHFMTHSASGDAVSNMTLSAEEKLFYAYKCFGNCTRKLKKNMKGFETVDGSMFGTEK